MLDYTTIDFETANSYRGSPCSIGLVRVRDGIPVEERHWLIRPPEQVDHFDNFNIALHGITPGMVATAPRWKDALPAIVAFIAGDIVVAHYAGFDIGVIRYACAVDNIEWPEIRFLCTMVLARRALSLPTYRLPYVLDALGGVIVDHHDALADARAVVGVVRGLAAAQGVSDLDALAASVGVSIGRMAGGRYKGSVATVPSTGGGSSPLLQPDINPNADPGGYLYGRVVVFTGALMSMTRQIAWEECARVGAAANESTTKRTNVLVVGDINPAVLQPGSKITGKARRAFELQEKGQDIEVMTEDDFLRCLGGKLLDEPEVLLSTEVVDGSIASPIPNRLRTVPMALRPEPQPPQQPKPPRALRRTPVPTTQACSIDNCTNTAAFKTRTKPTWCEQHIIEQQRRGGLAPLESFTHPDDWQLTECLTCTVRAHYRFEYTLDKNTYAESTCRACFWRGWAAQSREMQGACAKVDSVPHETAKTVAEEHGYEYLGPLTAPSLPNDPHHVRCRRCGRISAERLSDISSGCSTCTPRN
ncbi:exonuclease domain-containing protein [Rhodococcus sp. MEB032]|uniref:exonuclease domain-containing protein n=1 Tax=Rhodococcus sp. MEB032 TaxID=3040322 RepID=UPI00254E25A5|nr:exonuclease domain-containing protein [Rhodococcus sp. MEB032]